MKRFISLLALSIAGIAFTGCLSEQEKNSREAIKSLLAEAHFKRACAEGDSREAVKRVRKAAEQGLAGAQFKLGICYANGDGVEKDLREAVKWWRKAAEQGDVNAQEALKQFDK